MTRGAREGFGQNLMLGLDAEKETEGGREGEKVGRQDGGDGLGRLCKARREEKKPEGRKARKRIGRKE